MSKKSLEKISGRVIVGRRFQADDEKGPRGWVRYLGPVHTAKNSKAIYVGVEWDELGRGKHNGTVADQQYFSCRDGTGSFIHPKRVMMGTSFVGALKDRYSLEANALNTDGQYLVAKNGEQNSFKVPVQFVRERREKRREEKKAEREKDSSGGQGEKRLLEKLSKLDELVKVSLVACRLESAESLDPTEDSIGVVCPLVQELSLDSNLLSSWSQVHTIASQLKLRVLSLSDNLIDFDMPRRFHNNSENEREGENSCKVSNGLLVSKFTSSRCFHNLRVLALNQVPRAWHCALQFARVGCFGQLEELYLSKNGLLDLRATLNEDDDAGAQVRQVLSKGFPSLHLLDLSHNYLGKGGREHESWRQVSLLGVLPKYFPLALRHLVLNDNSLLEFSPPAFSINDAAKNRLGGSPGEEDEQAIPFASLEMLSLVNNLVENFRSLDFLQTLPRFSQLRFQGNPFNVHLGPGVSRMLCIVRLPRLVRLNLSEIRDRERMDAEKFYLKWCVAGGVIVSSNSNKSNSSESAKGDAARSFESFPYFSSLVALHGPPPGVSLVDGKFAAVSSTSSNSNLGALSSRMLELTIIGETKQIKKRFPPTTKLSAIMVLCKRLFKLEEPTILYRENEEDTPLELDQPMDTLAHFQVKSGGHLLVR